MKVVEVVVELGHKSVDYPFSYLLPDHLHDNNIIGKRVIIPFGPKRYQGFVISVKANNDTKYKLKEVIEIVDEAPVFSDEFIKLGKYISDESYSYLITAYQAMVPKSLKAKIGSIPNLKSEVYVEVNDYDLAERFIESEKRAKKQVEACEVMLSEHKLTRVNFNKTFSASILKGLVEKDILIIKKEEVYRQVFNEYVEASDKLALNNEQRNAYENIINQEANTYLLYGVTGSGKTEVYMQAIEDSIRQGKEAIVLVPEIALTKQMIKRFVSRFGKQVAILHSRLSDGERFDEYRKIYRKEVNIVVGARSAIFAPFNNLGLIVIDEEHEVTYKQESQPKYHALDIAKFRANYHNCSIVLGSATPSLESFARAKKGVYKLLEIKNRVNNQQLPNIEVVNMKEEVNQKNYSVISKRLAEMINDRLEKNQQIILLLNRRGYSTYLTCRDCGHAFKCPHCEISLTYHKDSNKMVCHYCNYQKPRVTHCEICNSKNIRDFGLGTEKLEEYINANFENAKVLRMDADTTTKKGSHSKILNAFERQEFNILLGTQMIAKGLDFDNVSLVGVINADYSINLPDFRASERTFQILSQVSGRAGRKNHLGDVVIQTFDDEHYSITDAKNHDYYKFFLTEMDIRHKLGYPPYFYLLKVVISSKSYRVVVKESQNIRDSLILANEEKMVVLGPSPASISKLRDLYRYQIIVKYKSGEKLKNIIKNISKDYQNNRNVYVDFENNPLRLF